MPTFEPRRIRRIGLAVEMENGETIMLYSDAPGIEISIDTQYEFDRVFHGIKFGPEFESRDTTITLHHVNQYTMQTKDAVRTDKAIQGIRKAITGGNPNENR